MGQKGAEAVGHGMEKGLDVDLQAPSHKDRKLGLQARPSRISLEWLGGIRTDYIRCAWLAYTLYIVSFIGYVSNKVISFFNDKRATLSRSNT